MPLSSRVQDDLAASERLLPQLAGLLARLHALEPAEMPDFRPVRKFEDRGPWALTGAADRPPNIISSLYLGAENLERVNLRLQEKLARIAEAEVRWDEYQTDDAVCRHRADVERQTSQQDEAQAMVTAAFKTAGL